MTYNKKSTGPVFQFILWLLLFIFICIVGISNVFGLETKTIYSNQTLDNSNQFNYGFVNAGGVDSITTGSVGSRISGKTKYINFYLSQNIALNYTYTIRINFLADDLQPYFSLNHVKEISVCNSSSCSNSSIISIKKQNNNGFSTWVELTFNPTQVGNVIGVTLGDNSGTYITGETFFGISSVQIESKNANQDVIDNATNNTNNIINNNNSNTESIINSNKETQQIIKDQFNTCRDSYNLFNLLDGTFLDSNNSLSTIQVINSNQKITITGSLGEYSSGSRSFSILGVKGGYSFTNYGNYFSDAKSITLTAGTYTLSIQNITGTFTSNRVNLYVYNASGNVPHTRILNINLLNSTSNSFTLTENTDVYFTFDYSSNSTFDNYSFNLQLQEGSVATAYEPFGEKICTNKLDEANETSKGIFGKLKDLFNWLTNDDDADVSSAGNVAGWLPPGPLDSLINLPLTMLTNINSSLNKTCSPLEVNLPYVNKTVEIPCLNTIFNQITGLNSFWTWVGMIGSVLILYRYLINLYNYYDKLTDLQANFISDWGSV